MKTFAWLSTLLVAVTFSTITAQAAEPSAIVQLGLILDASSSTEGEELNVFRAGVAAGIGELATDGSIELTVTQFRSGALVIFGPTLIVSETERDAAVSAVQSLDPANSIEEPYTTGTDIEEGILVTVDAMIDSPNAASAGLQFINILTDGNPTLHQHMGFEDIDNEARFARSRMFAQQARDNAIAAGIDVFSFEALGSRPQDIEFLETMAYPEPAVRLQNSDPDLQSKFPDPITANGFILEVADVSGIAGALTAKFTAAGLVVAPDPLELLPAEFDSNARNLKLRWNAAPGKGHRIEYRNGLDQPWKTDLPNSTFEPVQMPAVLEFTVPVESTGLRIFRVTEF